MLIMLLSLGYWNKQYINKSLYIPKPIETVEDLLTEYSTIKEIGNWIWENIEYTGDEEVWNKKDHWQAPNLTLKLKTGDCEDFSILLWECGQKLNIPVVLVGIVYKPLKRG